MHLLANVREDKLRGVPVLLLLVPAMASGVELPIGAVLVVVNEDGVELAALQTIQTELDRAKPVSFGVRLPLDA